MAHPHLTTDFLYVCLYFCPYLRFQDPSFTGYGNHPPESHLLAESSVQSTGPMKYKHTQFSGYWEFRVSFQGIRNKSQTNVLLLPMMPIPTPSGLQLYTILLLCQFSDGLCQKDTRSNLKGDVNDLLLWVCLLFSSCSSDHLPNHTVYLAILTIDHTCWVISHLQKQHLHVSNQGHQNKPPINSHPFTHKSRSNPLTQLKDFSTRWKKNISSWRQESHALCG